MADQRTNAVGFNGARLRNLRKKAGMSQEDLADAIHKNQQEVSDYERGAVVPGTGGFSIAP